MTIREVTYYQAVCDGPCGQVDDGGEWSAWSAPDGAKAAAEDAGWVTIGDKLVCPDCVRWCTVCENEQVVIGTDVCTYCQSKVKEAP